MQETSAAVFSDGLRLDGRFFFPEPHSEGRTYPLVIAQSGFTGLAQIHPARFARWLTRRGFACFSVDYRGYGRSEGTRSRVILDEQVRDIRSAVTVAVSAGMVDRQNVFLLGWAMGAGLVIDAARELDGVSGVCAINGLYDGQDFLAAQHGVDGLAKLRERIATKRLQRSISGIAEYVDPFEIYPLDDTTQQYVSNELEPVPEYDGATCSFEFAESLLRWSVLPVASAVRVPLFLAHAEANKLHPPDQARKLAEVYGGPVTTSWLEGVGHTEWMHDDNDVFVGLCERIYDWMKVH